MIKNLGGLLVLLIVVSSLSFVFSEDTITTINIEDSPPYIIKDIEDIFLIINENAINYLNLDDYFGEDNGDELTITWEPMDHVTITVDSEHRVSFYPATGFIGTQSTRFTVSDNAGEVTGNWFNITVGEDLEPPKWFNPQKSRTTIYQNTVLNLTTIWTDNVRLGSYVLSINEAGEWMNSTRTIFTGVQNISNTMVKVSAPPLSTVYWRFYAEDFYGNENVTDIQSFTVREFDSTGSVPIDTPYPGGTGAGGAAPPATIIESIIGEQRRSDFQTDINNLRVSLRQGDSSTRVIRITNTGTTRLEFLSAIYGLDRYAILGSRTFSLEPRESTRLIVDFNIPTSAAPDQYFGYIGISAGGEQVEIPIALEIRKFESEINLEVSVPQEYKAIKPGKTALANIVITSTKDIGEMNLSIHYAVKDFEGNIVNTSTKDIQMFASIEESLNLTIPMETLPGEYLFYVRVTGKDIIDIGSDTLFIGTRFQIIRFIEKFLYLIIFLILLITFLILYLNHKRNKKRQRALELYVMLNQLRELVKQGKTSDAVEIYKRIKVTYGQRISKSFQKDKELLKAELDKFANLLKQTPLQVELAPPQKTQATNEQSGNKSEGASKNKAISMIMKLRDKVIGKTTQVKPSSQAAQPQPISQPRTQAVQPKTALPVIQSAKASSPVAQPKPQITQSQPTAKQVPQAAQPQPISQPRTQAVQPKTALPVIQSAKASSPVAQPKPQITQSQPTAKQVPQAAQPQPVAKQVPQVVQPKPQVAQVKPTQQIIQAAKPIQPPIPTTSINPLPGKKEVKK